jgi:uncharacterized membrane protein YtjA (UPF0391 family)
MPLAKMVAVYALRANSAIERNAGNQDRSASRRMTPTVAGLRPSWNGVTTDASAARQTHPLCTGSRMIKWAIIFFIISLVAGFFGFTGVAEGSRTIAKVLFFIALAIFLIVLVFGVLLGILMF